ncbi:site-2 protease family protein, partial [Candidatus Saccharibacteria bacterium]|nr:site-2 protease family protein [Candidatus Saccharibacteria bacterium]
EAEEFGIGFPPAFWKRRIKSKRGDYDLTLNVLPLGGFVKLKGEHDADTHKGSFGAASLWAKSKIMLAGVAVNYMLAVVILTVVAITGMPKLITQAQFGEDQFTVARDTKVVRNDVLVGYVEPESPAASAGLKPGDQMISLRPEGQEQASKVNDSTELPSFTRAHAGQQVEITYHRDGVDQVATATLRSSEDVVASQSTDNPKGYLGIISTDLATQKSTWSAPIVAVGLSGQMTKLTLKGIWSALKGLGSLIAGLVTRNNTARSNGQEIATEQVSGPVGIFMVLKQGTERGFGFILFITGIISLTLAIMNVLPIPALDGGRFYMVLVSRGIFKRPLSQKMEERIVGTAFMALMVLFVLITIVDLKRSW